jgi:predicted nuclease of predicted toxin-antitoxin system
MWQMFFENIRISRKTTSVQPALTQLRASPTRASSSLPQNEILVDENCTAALLSALRRAKHDVVWVRDVQPGMDDDAVFAYARTEARVLLAQDQDFGHIAERTKERPPAVISVRLHGLPAEAHADKVVQAIANLGDAILGHFVVIGRRGIRARTYKD